MQAVKDRVDTLERVLQEYISQSNAIMERTEADTRALKEDTRVFKDEMRLFREDTQAFKDEMRLFREDTQAFKEEMRVYRDDTQAFKEEMRVYRDDTQAFKDEMRLYRDDTQAFKNEMRLYRESTELLDEHTKASIEHIQAAVERMEAETLAFKGEMREQLRERNREWAGVARKLGTLVEDLIAPAVRPALKKYFGIEPEFMAIRPCKRVAGEDYEVDVLCVCKQEVVLVEAKSSLRPVHIDELLEKILLFDKFFPEYAGRRAIPILATVVFPAEVLAYATRKRVYAMAFREWEYMDILNHEEIGG
ncbi:MAG: hypothetical protein AB1714_26180 [Acidobacteriota bacterium]